MSDDRGEFAKVNVTPLTDVAFTLLITLMLVTSYLAIKQPPFRVILPDVETVEPRGADVVTLDIDEKGENLAINGYIIKWDQYIKALKEEAIKDPYRMLLIRADKETPHGIVMRVLSDIKKMNSELILEDKEGFSKIAFGTRKKR
ncbi:MAG: biopolymer transporter ExbD [Candidatus Hydrothermales bacterium]